MSDLEPLPPSLARTWGNTETMEERNETLDVRSGDTLRAQDVAADRHSRSVAQGEGQGRGPMSLTPEQRRILDADMHHAGFASVEQYAWHLRQGLIRIADQPGGVWSRMAHETLSNGRPVDRASRAVAQRGHDTLDAALDDRLGTG